MSKYMSKYAESDKQREIRENNFTYHAPKLEQASRYEFIRSHARDFSKILNEECPASRELSLAQTKLEEVVFWANAAIARNEK